MGWIRYIMSHVCLRCHVTEISARCFATILKWNIRKERVGSVEVFILINLAGLILHYWRQNKTIAVIALRPQRFRGCVSNFHIYI